MNNKAPKPDLTALMEEGFGHVAAGHRDQAVRCFEDVVKTNSISVSETEKLQIGQAHNQLGITAMNDGEFDRALQHFDAAIATGGSHLVQDLNRAMVLIALGQLAQAENVLKEAIEKTPDDTRAAFHLGRVYQKQALLLKSIAIFEGVVKANPTWVEPLVELGISHQLNGETASAEGHFEAVRKQSPDLFQDYYNNAENLKNNHLYPDAPDALTRASKILPENPIPHHLVAVLFQILGEKDLAEKFLKKSLALHPTPESFGQLASLYEKSNALNDAWATANTALQFFPNDPYLHLTMARCERRAKKFDKALARLQKLEGKVADNILKTQIDFQLGWLYDQQNDIDKAFACYSRAKQEAAKNESNTVGDKEVSLQYIRDMKKLDLSKLPKGKTPKRPKGPAEVVFMVGFPRSGTTLLNQILDSHPRLIGLEEKPTIPGPAAILQQRAEGYPWGLENLDDEIAEKLRENYYQRIESFTDFGPDSIVVDKLPLNLVHLPLIWAMFPKAKIILALRHPMGCVLSCFMHNFRMNNAMANMFSMDDITSFYAKVMGLWQHFEGVRKTPVHTIKYEDVVTNIQGEAERICAFLGVEWSDEMLKYAQHARAKGLINTPSYHQVIQPLYTDSLERWRRYEKHLAPYKDRLAPFCETFDYRL